MKKVTMKAEQEDEGIFHKEHAGDYFMLYKIRTMLKRYAKYDFRHGNYHFDNPGRLYGDTDNKWFFTKRYCSRNKIKLEDVINAAVNCLRYKPDCEADLLNLNIDDCNREFLIELFYTEKNYAAVHIFRSFMN